MGERSDACLDRLLSVAKSEETDTWVRSAAAAASGQSGARGQAAEILLSLGQNERVEGGAQLSAIGALQTLGEGSDKVIRGLLQVIEDEDANLAVRGMAAVVLGGIGNGREDIGEALLSLLRIHDA